MHVILENNKTANITWREYILYHWFWPWLVAGFISDSVSPQKENKSKTMCTISFNFRIYCLLLLFFEIIYINPSLSSIQSFPYTSHCTYAWNCFLKCFSKVKKHFTIFEGNTFTKVSACHLSDEWTSTTYKKLD